MAVDSAGPASKDLTDYSGFDATAYLEGFPDTGGTALHVLASIASDEKFVGDADHQ